MQIDMGPRRITQSWAAGFLVLWAVLFFSPAAGAASAEQALPGYEQWQPYLEQSPATFEEFTEDPLGVILRLLPQDFTATIRQAISGYRKILLFLLLTVLISFFLPTGESSLLLDLAAAAGCAVLSWERLSELSVLLCENLDNWRRYLLGFIPIYAGVLTIGGEPAAAAAASGVFLSALCLLAQLLCAGVPPLLQCYYCLSISCCISTQASLAAACRTAGQILRHALEWAGKAFAAILSLQRIFTANLDKASSQIGQLLAGTVPIVGQTLNDASQTILAGIQLLKGGLGFAAMATMAVEFLPFYGILLLHSLLLTGCRLICTAAGIPRCGMLFRCLCEAVQCMAAATAMFFGLTILGTALMLAVGKG